MSGMDEQLRSLDDRELERLAYGRADTSDERATAAAAAVELARRRAQAQAVADDGSAGEREGQTPGDPTAQTAQTAEGAAAGAAAADESPEIAREHAEAHAHGRRMRAVGLAGVLAAALALPGVAWALTLPDPDPLAIFEDPQSPAAEAFVAELIGEESASAITMGPQLVRLEGGIAAIAFRASTVPDGRSTVWDAYCLLTTEDPSVDPSETESSDADANYAGDWQLSGNCVSPDRFEAQGIVAARRPVARDEGVSFDAVVWGPEGSPTIVQGLPSDAMEWRGSVLDALAFGGMRWRGSTPPMANASETDLLLMGPVQIASAGGDDNQALTVTAYLRDSVIEGVQGLEPEYCLQVTAVDGETAVECAALPLVERNGLTVTARAPSEMWLVELSPDGAVRLDRF